MNSVYDNLFNITNNTYIKAKKIYYYLNKICSRKNN